MPFASSDNAICSCHIFSYFFQHAINSFFIYFFDVPLARIPANELFFDGWMDGWMVFIPTRCFNDRCC